MPSGVFGASNALPAKDHSRLHVSTPVSVQHSQVVPYVSIGILD